jgi:ferric-dicitrate binding protein FerR (iron transport regulator)
MEIRIRPDGEARHVELKRGALLRVPGHRGMTSVEVERGRVWITREREARDYVVAPEGSLRLCGEGLVLVEALEDAALVLRA